MWNDLNTWRNKKLKACGGQADQLYGDLNNPPVPYDDKWNFSVEGYLGPMWSWVVKAESSNPNDPVIFFHPWDNSTWTLPPMPAKP
jgi:hypothetical protein